MKGTMRRKFICPNCQREIKARVMDTEKVYNGFRRYRQCEECGCNFATLEKVWYITGRRNDERETGA